MTIQGNYQLLDIINRDLHQLQQSSPALNFLLADKIRSFKNKNALRLNTMASQRMNLARKYCILNAEGEPQTTERDGNRFFSFINDEAQEKFGKELLEWMTSVTFNIEA